MQGGPNADSKRLHAELSEGVLATDQWRDIGRKTLVVAVVALTVWVFCALMRRAVEWGTSWVFATAEGYDSVLMGSGALLGIMVLVGLARGVLLLRPAWQDAEGDGIDKALARYHQSYDGGDRDDGGDGDGGRDDDPTVRYTQPTWSLAVRKLVTTALTIGGGGSGGLEAPGVYLGESLAAGWSRAFKRPSADELRLYQLAGIAAAIGALLQAPFTAALFAAEIVYAGRIIYRYLAYCLLAGVFAYELNHHLLGLGALFDSPSHGMTFVWQEYLLVTIVAVGFSAPSAIALGPVFKRAERVFVRVPTIVRPAAGVLIAAAVAIGMWLAFDLRPEHILGIGEQTMNEVANGVGPATLRVWWILLLAVVAKTLATAATLKSGGSVGMLFPSMYMGALVGAACFYLLGEIGLYAGPSVTVFVATGMAAALTAVAGVPLAAIALVLEVFGSEYGPAAALACAVCFTASKRFSLYTRLPEGG